MSVHPIIVELNKKEKKFIETEPLVRDFFKEKQICMDNETIYSTMTSLFNGTCEDKNLVSHIEKKLEISFPTQDIKENLEWKLFFHGFILKYYWKNVYSRPELWNRDTFDSLLKEYYNMNYTKRF